MKKQLSALSKINEIELFIVKRFGKKRVTLELIYPEISDNFAYAEIKVEGERFYLSTKRCMTRKEFDKNYLLRK